MLPNKQTEVLMMSSVALTSYQSLTFWFASSYLITLLLGGGHRAHKVLRVSVMFFFFMNIKCSFLKSLVLYNPIKGSRWTEQRLIKISLKRIFEVTPPIPRRTVDLIFMRVRDWPLCTAAPSILFAVNWVLANWSETICKQNDEIRGIFFLVTGLVSSLILNTFSLVVKLTLNFELLSLLLKWKGYGIQCALMLAL